MRVTRRRPPVSALPLRIVDHAAPKELFERLAAGIAAVGSERLRSTYQTTFWFDLRARPAAIPEELILSLRRRMPRGLGLVGVEWWLSRMSTHDVRVDFHQDRDERLALRTGCLRHPRVSTVLFVNRVEGGLLAVTWEKPCEDNPSLAPAHPDFDLVRPEPNRLAIFDGRMTHGVLDARNQIPSRRLPGKGELRLTLVMNWWTRRPTEVPTFDERRIYRALAVTA